MALSPAAFLVFVHPRGVRVNFDLFSNTQEVDESDIVEAQSIWKKGGYCTGIIHTITVSGLCVGSQLNRQHVPSVDHSELARETERLDRKCVLLLMTILMM